MCVCGRRAREALSPGGNPLRPGRPPVRKWPESSEQRATRGLVDWSSRGAAAPGATRRHRPAMSPSPRRASRSGAAVVPGRVCLPPFRTFHSFPPPLYVRPRGKAHFRGARPGRGPRALPLPRSLRLGVAPIASHCVLLITEPCMRPGESTPAPAGAVTRRTPPISSAVAPSGHPRGRWGGGWDTFLCAV